MLCHVTHTVSLGCLWAHWPSLARWPSILLARWPIVELASSINIPQWHLTKYTHVELEINEQIKLTKAGENYVASTIRTMLAWRYNLCALRMVRCKTIDLFFTTSLESQESYLTIRNLTLQTFRSVTREFFSLHSTLAQLYNAAALPALHLCSAGSLAITILKRIQDSIFAPAMNPDASKLILMNFPCERRM